MSLPPLSGYEACHEDGLALPSVSLGLLFIRTIENIVSRLHVRKFP